MCDGTRERESNESPTMEIILGVTAAVNIQLLMKMQPHDWTVQFIFDID